MCVRVCMLRRCASKTIFECWKEETEMSRSLLKLIKCHASLQKKEKKCELPIEQSVNEQRHFFEVNRFYLFWFLWHQGVEEKRREVATKQHVIIFIKPIWVFSRHKIMKMTLNVCVCETMYTWISMYKIKSFRTVNILRNLFE